MNTNDLDWFLNGVAKAPYARHAVLPSADGMLRAHSARTSRDRVNRRAAALPGLQSISRGIAELMDGDATPWRQPFVAFDTGCVFLAAESALFLNTSLLVLPVLEGGVL
jgi:predicted regulator of Ras-like GTPase activity (Roadblock/LC7/MglB family)